MEEIIGTIAAAIAVITGFYQGGSWLMRKLKNKSEQSAEDPVSTVASRFVQLFEAHGVYRNQIPELFDRELTIADMQSDDALITKLTPALLTEAAELFQINSEWLAHGQGQIFPQHYFYKDPDRFGKYIDQIKQDDDTKHIEGYVLSTKPPYGDEYNTIILLKEQISTISDRPIYRYHFCTEWNISYWKCCADIACCIAQAQMREIYLAGKYVKDEWITAFNEGKTLPGYDFDLSEISLPRIGRWGADEFVDIPEKFVKPLSKDDGYSVENSINRWLGYHDKGLIYVHSDRVDNGVRRAFKEYRQRL